MKNTDQILQETGITKVAFSKYREMGLVDSYSEKRAVTGKIKAGFQYYYEDSVVDQIREVRRKMADGISLAKQQKTNWQDKQENMPSTTFALPHTGKNSDPLIQKIYAHMRVPNIHAFTIDLINNKAESIKAGNHPFHLHTIGSGTTPSFISMMIRNYIEQRNGEPCLIFDFENHNFTMITEENLKGYFISFNENEVQENNTIKSNNAIFLQPNNVSGIFCFGLKDGAQKLEKLIASSNKRILAGRKITFETFLANMKNEDIKEKITVATEINRIEKWAIKQ